MNMNEDVWVKLTSHGEYLWDQYWMPTSRVGVPDSIRRNRTEVNGRVRFELWSLMAVFGPHIYMGGQLPFQENEVYFTSGIEEA